MPDQSNAPIVIIGSVRSGTNMLRDILTTIPELGTWDCDEINPIWRHGNINHPDDELTTQMVTPSLIKFIRKEFNKIKNKLKVERVVEKTTANALRVNFVYKILPEAKYIFIYRDGRDVAASAKLRWVSSFDLKYSLKKFRYVPKVDMPAIGYFYIKNRILRILKREKKLPTWGPIYKGMVEDTKKYSLIELCGLQWKHYVEKTLAEIGTIPENQLLKIKYEDFVSSPKKEMSKVCTFLNIPVEYVEKYSLIKKVSNKSVGNWTKLSEEEKQLLKPIVTPTLKKLGYLS